MRARDVGAERLLKIFKEKLDKCAPGWEKLVEKEKKEKARIKKRNEEFRARNPRAQLRLCRRCGYLFRVHQSRVEVHARERADSRGDLYPVIEWTIKCPRKNCYNTVTLKEKLAT